MYICKEVAIYDYMNRDDYISNQDIIALLFQRLKEYRLAARMSQKELAERSGVGLTTICHLEQGANRNITLNNFISLLRAVGMETAFTRAAAGTAHAPDGIETDKQVHT